MGAAENMALSRRVDKLDRAILAVEPKRIRTIFRVYKRGAETPCKDAADARKRAALDPVVELVGEYPDLDVLIDAQTGARIQRAANDTIFDELAEGVEVLVVYIDCYLEQLRQIRSDAPITASEGGTQAGKTRALVWWLFRQWLIRGHGVDEDHELGAVFWWVREDSGKLYKHAVLWLTRLWPDVFVGKRPSATTLNPSLELVDGSRIDFKHAAHSGSKAGISLRSESALQAIVADELSAIHDQENWRELKSRVARTGGRIAVAFTPTAGHWSAQLAKQAPASGGTIQVARLTMFNNPWWPVARMLVDLLAAGAITATELVEKILPAADIFAALDAAVTDPHVRRMRFGEAQSLGLTLWRRWSKDYIVRDHVGARDVLEVGHMRASNITAAAVGREFGSRGRHIETAGGKDFNVNPGVTIVYQVFGAKRAPYVLIFDEIADVGPTLVNAESVSERYPGLCMFCDPTGAMDYRHASHGSRSSTDAEEMRRAGLGCEPANGESKGSVDHLGQLDSLNVLHRAMSQGLIRVHSRCTGLLRALDEMQAQPDGRVAKVSGRDSVSDQISAYGDAMRYGLWPVFRDLLLPESPFFKGAA